MQRSAPDTKKFRRDQYNPDRFGKAPAKPEPRRQSTRKAAVAAAIREARR